MDDARPAPGQIGQSRRVLALRALRLSVSDDPVESGGVAGAVVLARVSHSGRESAMVDDGGMSTTPFVESDVNSRPKRPSQADERTTTVAFLRWHRETLRLKCAGLRPAQLVERAVGRSALSLLGLVRHAAESERFWFRQVMAGQDAPPLFSSPAAPDGAFDVASADAQMVAQAWEAWRAEVAFADRFVAAAPDLDVIGNEPGEGPVSLRWVLMHMVEEYARHNGHADLLREQIDGAVGL